MSHQRVVGSFAPSLGATLATATALAALMVAGPAAARAPTAATAAATPATTAAATTAATPKVRCTIARVNMPRIEAALARLARPRASAQPSRLWALLPVKLTTGARQSVNTGAGLYVADDAARVRWLAGDRRGWSVRLSWDLGALWRPTAARAAAAQRNAPLAHALRVERVASQVANAVRIVGRARAAVGRR